MFLSLLSFFSSRYLPPGISHILQIISSLEKHSFTSINTLPSSPEDEKYFTNFFYHSYGLAIRPEQHQLDLYVWHMYLPNQTTLELPDGSTRYFVFWPLLKPPRSVCEYAKIFPNWMPCYPDPPIAFLLIYLISITFVVLYS